MIYTIILIILPTENIIIFLICYYEFKRSIKGHFYFFMETENKISTVPWTACYFFKAAIYLFLEIVRNFRN